MTRKIIIDTDPGIDDAVAIAIALYAKELDVQLITTVAGNVGLENVTTNYYYNIKSVDNKYLHSFILLFICNY